MARYNIHILGLVRRERINWTVWATGELRFCSRQRGRCYAHNRSGNRVISCSKMGIDLMERSWSRVIIASFKGKKFKRTSFCATPLESDADEKIKDHFYDQLRHPRPVLKRRYE
ncbi:hypothetical protein PoB_004744800 [Plakobranchus ocellatus]|uniref:Uncharacterized protein n=1 Tax=Plakobranchus ocellatus TaxID=259542 RepID=A0AAV4BPA3_9GAST|nr:hypothetical protein PoB_004744800 [Plakobranchus ocellatus]